MLNSDGLLRILHEIEPIFTEKQGVLIPYGAIYKKATSFSRIIGREQIEILLTQLQSYGKIEIIYQDKSILGVRVK